MANNVGNVGNRRVERSAIVWNAPILANNCVPEFEAGKFNIVWRYLPKAPKDYRSRPGDTGRTWERPKVGRAQLFDRAYHESSSPWSQSNGPRHELFVKTDETEDHGLGKLSDHAGLPLAAPK